MQALKNRLHQVEDRIRELKDRLPAHSVKPSMMMELIALEDERDELRTQLQAQAKKPPG